MILQVDSFSRTYCASQFIILSSIKLITMFPTIQLLQAPLPAGSCNRNVI
jgi:hypothetical protein